MKKLIAALLLVFGLSACSDASGGDEPPASTSKVAIDDVASAASAILAKHGAELHTWTGNTACATINESNGVLCTAAIGSMAEIAQTVVQEATTASDALPSTLKGGGGSDFAEAAQEYIAHGCDKAETYADPANTCTMDFLTAKTYFTSFVATLEKSAK